MEKKIEPIEITNLLKGIILGELSFGFEPSFFWNDKYNTTIRFNCERYIIEIFIDNDELDYVDWAESPDGRKGNYDYWELDICPDPNPVEMLSDEEHDALIQRFVEKQQEIEDNWKAEKEAQRTYSGIEPSEMLPIFKGIISGEYDMEFVKGYYWGGKMTTNIRFVCQGYEIELFHDVNHIDYTVVAIAPDGREAGYDYWETKDADGDDPIAQLTEEEHDLLVQRFEEKHEHYMTHPDTRVESVKENGNYKANKKTLTRRKWLKFWKK